MFIINFKCRYWCYLQFGNYYNRTIGKALSLAVQTSFICISNFQVPILGDKVVFGKGKCRKEGVKKYSVMYIFHRLPNSYTNIRLYSLCVTKKSIVRNNVELHGIFLLCSALI